MSARAARFLLPLAAAFLLSGSAPANGIETVLGDETLRGVGRVFLSDRAGGVAGQPLKPGDFDGDGFADVVTTPFRASLTDTLGNVLRRHNGEAIVFFGDGTTTGTIDNATYQGRRLVIQGARDSSILGVESDTGDLDGDGVDDIILGSAWGVNAGLPEASGAGEVAVLFGRRDWGTTVRQLDLLTLPAFQRTRFIVGQDPNDRLGSWVRARDLDADGCLDLILGMDQADGPANDRQRAGAAVIVWGPVDGADRPAVLRLADAETSPLVTLIHGVDAADMLGATHGSGDWNGDGRLDLAISAGVTRSGLAAPPGSSFPYSASGGGDGPPGELRPNAGEVVLLWDAGALRAHREIDLALPPPTGLSWTFFYGSRPADYFGEELTTGDLDGDGIQDLVVGALTADPGGMFSGGEGYVLWGSPVLHHETSLDVQTLGPDRMLRIPTLQSGAIGADTITVADINQDGLDDLLYAAPYGTWPFNGGDEFFQNGWTLLLFGTPALRQETGPLTLNRDFLEFRTRPDLTRTILAAEDAGDFFAYSATVEDLNHDGFPDYLPNSMQGDGFQNLYQSAGEYAVVDGLELLRRAAAPRVTSGPGADVLTWETSQPAFGPPITGYEVITWTFDLPTTSDSLSIVPLPVEARSYDPGEGVEVFGIRAVTLRAYGTPEVSAWAGPQRASIPEAYQPPAGEPLPNNGERLAELLQALLFPSTDQGVQCRAPDLDENGDGVVDVGDVVEFLGSGRF